MKLKRLAIGFLIGLVVVYAGIIWWIQSGLQIKIVKQNNRKMNESKQEAIENKSNSKVFLFINLGSKLLKTKKHIFPLSLETNAKISSNWRILDLLNFHYSQWHSLYNIDNKILKMAIKTKNKIFYQPKIKVLEKFYIQNITAEQLKTITKQETKFNKKLKSFFEKKPFQRSDFIKWSEGKITKKASQSIYQRLRKQIVFN